MPYEYVPDSERKEASDLIIELIKKETGKSYSNYSLIDSFEKIGMGNLDATAIVIEIEDKYGVKINASPRIKSGESIDLSTPRKKKWSFLEKVVAIFVPDMAKEVFGRSKSPSPPYEPDETGFSYKDFCYLTPETVLKSTYDQLEAKRKAVAEENARVLKPLLEKH